MWNGEDTCSPMSPYLKTQIDSDERGKGSIPSLMPLHGLLEMTQYPGTRICQDVLTLGEDYSSCYNSQL